MYFTYHRGLFKESIRISFFQQDITKAYQKLNGYPVNLQLNRPNFILMDIKTSTNGVNDLN